MLDTRIDNATVFDGYDFREARSLGISGAIIEYMGNDAAPAHTVIDARGRLLTPAFVDSHSHADLMVRHTDNDGGSSIAQGVATLVVGNCGMSGTPVAPTCSMLFNKDGEHNLDRQDHLQCFSHGLSLNIGELIGHGTLRTSILGEARAARAAEVADMCALLREYLESGWVGMSVGLNYPQASGYSKAELIALAKVLGRVGRPLTCHIRDQGARILDAMDEVIDVGAAAGCAVLISHLRLLSHDPRQITGEMQRRIDDHAHVHFDMYPYVAGCTTLELFLRQILGILPQQASPLPAADLERAVATMCLNSFEDLHVVRHRNPAYVKRTVAMLAQQMGGDPGSLVQTIFFEDPSCMCIFDNTSARENVDTLIQHGRCLMGSDAWLYPSSYRGAGHPRNFAAFTGFLARYVRNGPIDLVSGLRRVTSKTADYFGLDAGRIKVGGRADLALFTLKNLEERADFQNPSQISGGMEGVWIAGRRVLENERVDAVQRPGARLPAVDTLRTVVKTDTRSTDVQVSS